MGLAAFMHRLTWAERLTLAERPTSAEHRTSAVERLTLAAVIPRPPIWEGQVLAVSIPVGDIPAGLARAASIRGRVRSEGAVLPGLVFLTSAGLARVVSIRGRVRSEGAVLPGPGFPTSAVRNLVHHSAADWAPVELVGIHLVPAVLVGEKPIGLVQASVEVRLAQAERLADLEELEWIVRRLKADSTVFLACHPTRGSTASARRLKAQAV
jgi:hypothetical protein